MLLLIPGLIVAAALSVLAHLLSKNTILPIKLSIYIIIGVVGMKTTNWIASAILGVVLYSYVIFSIAIIVFDSLIRWISNKLLGGNSHARHDRQGT